MNRSNIGATVVSGLGTIAQLAKMKSMAEGIAGQRKDAADAAKLSLQQAANLEKYRADKDVAEMKQAAGVAKDAVGAYAEGVESAGAFTSESIDAAIKKFGPAGAKEVMADFRTERMTGMSGVAREARSEIRSAAYAGGADEKFMRDADRLAMDPKISGDQAIQQAFAMQKPLGQQFTQEFAAERAGVPTNSPLMGERKISPEGVGYTPREVPAEGPAKPPFEIKEEELK